MAGMTDTKNTQNTTPENSDGDYKVDAGTCDSVPHREPMPRPPKGLDPGIREAVLRLQDDGVHTFESCEGGTGHAFAVPSVKFYGNGAEGWRALAVAKNAGLPVVRLHRAWDLDDGEPCGPYWLMELRG